MSKIKLKGIPTFRILDYAKAIEFYIDGLGFDIDWEHRFGSDEPVYMQISKNGLVLHLSENKRFQTGVVVFVESKELNALHTELVNNGVGLKPSKPEKTNWQTLQMEIEDPFGNLLRFNESVVE